MKIEQIYTGCLAQGAYYISSKGEAAIIDPLREVQSYIDRAKKDHVKIKYIFETHFHADFVSGHVTLAEKTGAEIVYGPTANPTFPAIIAKDGQEFKIGDITIRVLHTPGHTMESSTYLLIDEQGNNHAIFTGDTLFLGDVGRPDLAQKAAHMTQEQLAGLLFDSLRTKIMPLADETIVYPAHGAGSACGKNMMKETVDTLGNQKKMNYALNPKLTREEFIKQVTDGLLPPPQYFAQNVALNKSGYQSIDDVLKTGVVPLPLDEFTAYIEDDTILLMDTRSKTEFVNGHIPGSIYIGLDGSFAPWVGALIPDLQQKIVFIADEGMEEEVVIRLARVGFDNTLGYLEGGFKTWKDAGRDVATINSISPEEFAKNYGQWTHNQILDVRKPTEFLSHHVLNSTNLPLDYLNNNMDKLDKDQKYVLFCNSGYRSVIAASILMARGFRGLTDVREGFQGISETSAPVSAYTCPTEISQEVLDSALAEVM
ncbi:MAG: MBL fold metallo-hydrolase [Saprospiraceae bacterium]|nr:MBL fold metallo-hydrolase [Saprospiraceae bacterium]